MRFELKGFFSPVDNSPLVNAAKVGNGLSYVGERSLRRLWKTKKAWAGSCRRVVVQLADGPLPTASVRFVK
jgi:hypothetical protein